MSPPAKRPFRIVVCCLSAILIVSSLVAYGARPHSHDTVPPPAGMVLAHPLLSAGAIRAEMKFLPADLIPVLNGMPTAPQTAHDAADVRLVAQVRFTGSGILGSHTPGEALPYLRVRATVTNETTGASITALLRPTASLGEGWHYSSNLDLPGTPATDRYRVLVRIAPPSVLRTEPDFLVTGTLLDSATEILISNIQVNLQSPPPVGNFPVTVREGLSS